MIQTLIGVAAGGAATYLTQRGLDERRERREHERDAAEAQRDREASAAVFRGASRLVLTDLHSVFNLLRSTRASGAWWVRLRLPTRTWHSYRDALAKELDDKTFRAVGVTFSVADNWNAFAAAAEKSYWLQPRFKLSGVDGLAGLRDQLLSASTVAIELLVPIALPGAPSDDPLLRLIADVRSQGSDASITPEAEAH